MRRNAMLSIILLLLVLFVALPSSAAQTGKALQITAPENVYAYIYRPFSTTEAVNIELEARVKVGPNSGDSWTPSIVLYWEPLHYIAHGQCSDGYFRANHFSLGMSGRRSAGIAAGAWVDLRILVTPTQIQLGVRQDGGEWQTIARINRPSDMYTVPSGIIIGKGFENAVDAKNPQLRNSLTTDSGSVGSVLITDVRLVVDEREVFYETFANLDQWQVHFDADFRESVSLTIAEK